MRAERWYRNSPGGLPATPGGRRGSRTRLAVLCVVIMLSAGCAVTRPPLVYENGVGYGQTDGIWRDRWWNYYEAGIDYSRVDKGLDLSVHCFRQAIAQRPKDQYRARTYGVHFMEEYFPHRELGIALYRSADYDAAIRELETSRSHTDSARARYYLNKAMGAHLKSLDLDTASPRITIASPVDSEVTAGFFVQLSGTVTDDRGVVRVLIDGRPQDLELASEQVQFVERIDLQPGLNVIEVKAEDLTGKRTETSVNVVADWDGPLLAVTDPLPDEILTAQTVSVRGTVADTAGVSSLRINGIEVPVEGIPGAAESGFVHELMLQPGMNTISLAAVDSVGNKTISEFPVVYRERTSATTSIGLDRIMVAMAGDYLPARYAAATGGGESVSPGGQETEPVRIVLADLRDYQSTLYDWTRVSGTAIGTQPLRSVAINGNPLVTASLNRSHVSFSRKVPLDLGDNDINVEAADVDGRLARRTVRVERKEPELAGIRHRMALAVPKCIKIGSVNAADAEMVYELLVAAFISGGRFHMPARGTALQPVLDELALSATIFVDKETVQQKGSLVGADAVLLVSVNEWNDQFSVMTKLVNTETGSYMAEDTEPDIFAEGKDINIIREKMQILADRYAMAFPLLKGKVVEIRGGDVITNVGREQGLKEQMKFHVYEELDAIVDPETGEELLTDVDIRSQAFILDVYEKASRAEVVKQEALPEIDVGDSVMTK